MDRQKEPTLCFIPYHLDAAEKHGVKIHACCVCVLNGSGVSNTQKEIMYSYYTRYTRYTRHTNNSKIIMSKLSHNNDH